MIFNVAAFTAAAMLVANWFALLFAFPNAILVDVDVVRLLSIVNVTAVPAASVTTSVRVLA